MPPGINGVSPMKKKTAHNLSRRRFLASTAVAAAATSGGAMGIEPAAETVIGEGDYRYGVLHAWPQLPDKFSWQTTHNVAVDKDGFLYVIHEGRKQQKDHPSIFVFDPKGRYLRSFGKQFQGGGHGIEVRQEGGEQFLYVCAYQHLKTFAKMSLKGEVVWQKHAPMKSGVYAENEDTKPTGAWGRNRFMPTNFAFLDDGGFLLVDGYGAYCIHEYDKDGNWKRHFGGPGRGKGTFNLPHGIWIDRRSGRKPSIAVCDRANHTVQYLDMDGKYLDTLTGYGLPANADTWKNLMVVPELHARVTILDEKNKVVARLGDDIKRIKGKGGGRIRTTPSSWRDGRFVHPHDACFDNDGNILVAEWVGTGRVTKLVRMG